MCVGGGVQTETENESNILSFVQFSHYTNASTKTLLVDIRLQH